MTIMNHKDYTAHIKYSAENECFIGHIAGTRDVIGFHGQSVAELKSAFEEAVDDYLATCERLHLAVSRCQSAIFKIIESHNLLHDIDIKRLF